MARDNIPTTERQVRERAEELRRIAAHISLERDRRGLLKMADECEAFARKMAEKGCP